MSVGGVASDSSPSLMVIGRKPDRNRISGCPVSKNRSSAVASRSHLLSFVLPDGEEDKRGEKHYHPAGYCQNATTIPTACVVYLRRLHDANIKSIWVAIADHSSCKNE